MKRFLLLLVCALVLGSAVSNAYEPIVKEGKQWVYYEIREIKEDGRWKQYAFPMMFYFEGDTTINGYYSYKKLYEDCYTVDYNAISVHHFQGLVACARENDNGEVVVYYKNNYVFPFIGRCSGYEIIIYNRLDQSLEAIQQHFDNVGLTVRQRNRYGTFTGTGTININGSSRHVYNTNTDYIKLIEGIGLVQTNKDNFKPIANFLYLRDDTENNWIFSHLIENGEIVFKGELYDYFAELDYFKNHQAEYSEVEDIEVVNPSSNGIYYDMQGRRIAEPTQPGIYIRDGKKVIVN